MSFEVCVHEEGGKLLSVLLYARLWFWGSLWIPNLGAQVPQLTLYVACTREHPPACFNSTARD